MKDIKLIHLAVAAILVLISVAAVQSLRLPATLPVPVSVTGADQLVDLPSLPQNEIYNNPVVKPPAESPPPFKESVGENEQELQTPNAGQSEGNATF